MPESYYMVVVPKFLKVEHSFAKTIKPNTKYRLAIFKGIQKCDQMKEGIKSKVVGGKIDLQSPLLNFNVANFLIQKNMQFTIKLLETKPSQQQVQLCCYPILSSEYIKELKSQSQSIFQIQGHIRQDISILFTLYVEKSKHLLNELIKGNDNSSNKIIKDNLEDVRSQNSSRSGQLRDSDGFASPKKRIERKKGRQGRLRSKSKESQISDVASVTSERKIFRNSPPSQKNQKIVQSIIKTPLNINPTKLIQNNFKIQSSRTSQIKSPMRNSLNQTPQQTKSSYKYQPKKPKQTVVTQELQSNLSSSLIRSGVRSPYLNSVGSPAEKLTSPNNQFYSAQNLQIQNTAHIFDILPKKTQLEKTKLIFVQSGVKDIKEASPIKALQHDSIPELVLNIDTVKKQKLRPQKTPKKEQNLKKQQSLNKQQSLKKQYNLLNGQNLLKKEQNFKNKQDLKKQQKPKRESTKGQRVSSGKKQFPKLKIQQKQKSKKQTQTIKQQQPIQTKGFLVNTAFLLISMLLIYLVMLPTKRV